MAYQIKLENLDNVWFVSDLHLYHKNIAGKDVSNWDKGYRDFKNEYVMTDHLIDQINKYVKEDDILFNLGDFLFKNHKLIPEARNRIVCQTIHHVMGNHDHHIHKYKDCFASVNDDVELSIANNGDLFILHHYAKRVWFASHKGSYHLYGHSHDSLDRHPNEAYGKSMDVGVDSAYRIFGEYRPFHAKEIKQILNKRNTKFVDHHNSETNTK